MKARHEVKHLISLSDYYILRQRMRMIMQQDHHVSDDGRYRVRSLYFDNLDDTALYEKLDGVQKRDKYRIRYYNQDTSFIRLEKKSKIGDACIKRSAPITKEGVQLLLNGETDWMKEQEEALVRELYQEMSVRMLRPKTIVDYIRDPFVFPAGNVRVTLDHHIRTGMNYRDFLNPDNTTIPAAPDIIILEVKWDEYLPDMIRDLIRLGHGQAAAFSKYAACRAADM